MLRGHLRRVIFSFLFVACFARPSFASNCKSLLAALQQTEARDWTQKDRSLGAVVLNSALWLSAVEAPRLSGGGEAFQTAFFANTSIDIVLTAISHQISMGNVPEKFKKLFEGEQSYKRRAKVNTFMAMSVLLPIWTIAAAASGAEAGSLQAWMQGEVIHPIAPVLALGLFYSAYRAAPYIKNFMFRSLPQRADAREWAKFEQRYPEASSQVESAAKSRAEELHLESENIENLVMSMMEVTRLRIAYEDRLDSSLKADRKLQKIVEEIETASEETKPALRKKLIARLIKLHEEPNLQMSVMQALHLGSPFDSNSSLEVHKQLQKRNWKAKIRLTVSAFADQSLWVGFLGGVVLRHITGMAF